MEADEFLHLTLVHLGNVFCPIILLQIGFHGFVIGSHHRQDRLAV